MKWLDEYREAKGVLRIAEEIKRCVTRPHTLMEVCGGQTHTLVKYALEDLLPAQISLIHGPGCPVCVTPIQRIDQALDLASREGLILCTFGDMLRVPGSHRDLRQIKATGGDVRIVYSPVDAVAIARQHPDKEVVFFSVGFETTAPAAAMAVYVAAQQQVANFSLLVSHVLVPPALLHILEAPSSRVDGFLAAGHVCTVMGYEEYHSIARQYHVPIVVTGFEPLDLMQGIAMCVKQLEEGRAEVENQYSRSVTATGNTHAQAMLARVFVKAAQRWRGLGALPQSGLALAEEYRAFDAIDRFGLDPLVDDEADNGCQSGLILQGLRKPKECPAFGRSCTPEHPLGAPMVSSEGACAAYYLYQHHEATAESGADDER